MGEKGKGEGGKDGEEERWGRKKGGRVWENGWV